MKKNILLILTTALICITGTSYAAYKLTANQVLFNNNKLLESNDVQGAIDELSNLASVQINKLQIDVNNINEKINNLDYILSLCNGLKTDENTWVFFVPFDKAPEFSSSLFALPIDLSKYQVVVKSATVYRYGQEFASDIIITDLSGSITLRMKKDSKDITGVMTYKIQVTPK